MAQYNEARLRRHSEAIAQTRQIASAARTRPYGHAGDESSRLLWRIVVKKKKPLQFRINRFRSQASRAACHASFDPEKELSMQILAMSKPGWPSDDGCVPEVILRSSDFLLEGSYLSLFRGFRCVWVVPAFQRKWVCAHPPTLVETPTRRRVRAHSFHDLLLRSRFLRDGLQSHR